MDATRVGRSTDVGRPSGVGLLTTYRKDGEPVTTPVSVAESHGRLYFVTSVGSGKARRLAVRADVTVAPSTVRGVATGPAAHGAARRVDEAERLRVRRLLRPGGPLFWSYALYRLRGHRLHVFEVTLTGRDAATGAERSS